MRSFHLLSLVSSVFLLLCSPSEAQQLHRHEKPRARHRHKRDTNVVFTYFNDGLGACGVTNSPNDFIVALNAAEYGGGAHCFEMITIVINGKTAQAQIVDECVGCSYGGLDFSQGLFEYFAPLSQGELSGSWSYNSDIVTSSSTSTTLTAYTRTSATSTITTSSSEASSTTSTIILTPTIVSSPTSTTFTVPTSTPQSLQNIAQINLALAELGTLLRVSLQIDA